jgi:signal transduction histidine kinase
MKFNSLAFRLYATAAAWTLLALPLAGFLVYSLYHRETVDTYNERISNLLTVVTAASLDDGSAAPARPGEVGEPLFAIAGSGFYWQVTPLDSTAGTPLRSASLDGRDLALPSSLAIPPSLDDPDRARWADLVGPYGEVVRVAEVVRSVGDEMDLRRYSFAVAHDIAWLDRRLVAFRDRLVIALALAGLGLLAVTWLQVRFGLQPLAAIERGLAAIRAGRSRRLGGELPSEIAPLQHEINALLASNEEVIDRARTQVGNLAHALKTPLAVITNEARESGEVGAGAKIAEQAELMRRQIGYYLDRARVAAGVAVIGRVTEVRPVAEAITRALERIYRERAVTFAMACPADARFAGEQQDLEEMLGNLLDNAGKWATGRVRLAVDVRAGAPAAEGVADATLFLRIEDDGPGLTPEQIEQALARGRRLDESKPGSGLGLSIVADLVQSYRGRFELGRSEFGGLAATLYLPAVRG